MPDALLDGDVGSPLQVPLDLGDGTGISVMVPDGLEAAVAGALDQRIGAVLVGIVPCAELFVGHVGRVEAGSGRPGAVSREESLPVDTVPGSIIDFRIEALGRIRERAQEDVRVAEILLPIDPVHLVGGHPVQPEDFFSIVGDAGQVRGGDGHLGVIVHEPAHIHPVPGAGNGQDESGREYEQSFHTVWFYPTKIATDFGFRRFFPTIWPMTRPAGHRDLRLPSMALPPGNFPASFSDGSQGKALPYREGSIGRFEHHP